MNRDEFNHYDAVGLASLIKKGEVSAREVVETSISVMESLNPDLNAVIATDFENALESSRLAATDAPLYGVPYLLKDLNTWAKGMAATHGSRAFQHFLPELDSTLVARLRGSGLIILGKTNTPEFGLNMCTCPSLFGATPNPFDPKRSAGGSSGGSGCAVASGMVPAAHATDSGGSIRIPASNCGLFGLKPTRSRVPLGNDQSEGLAGFSTAHAITHSVRDSALLMDLTRGPLHGDAYTAPAVSASFFNVLSEPFRPPRIGFWDQGFADEPVHQSCREAVYNAAQLCETLGCQVTRARPSIDGFELRSALDILFSANICNLVQNIAAARPSKDISTLVEPVTLSCSESAQRFSASDYAAAVAATQRAAKILGSFFNEYDVLLTPTLANPPLLLGELNMQGPDWSVYLKRLLDEIPFTPLYNATGTPAASVPLGQSSEGLPIGVQIGASFGSEAVLLRLAREFEIAAPWHNRI